MNFHIVDKSICEYLQRSVHDYSIMINGEWGIGKTYYINNFINEIKSDTENESSFYLLVSVAGLETPKDAIARINDEYNCQRFGLNGKYKIAFEATKKLLYVGFNVREDIKDIAEASEHFIKKIAVENKISRFVIFIDDLERYKGCIDELLSCLNEFYITNGAHLIYICNEKAIDSREYRLSKEKYIRYTILFHLDFNRVLPNIIEAKGYHNNKFVQLYADYSTDVLDLFDKYHIYNLRTIMICMECYDFFATSYVLSKNQALHLLTTILLICSWKNSKFYLEGNSTEFNEYLNDQLLYSDVLGMYIRKGIYKYKYETFSLEPVILKFLNQGYVSSNEVSLFFSENYEPDNEYIESFYELVDNYKYLNEVEIRKHVKFICEGFYASKLQFKIAYRFMLKYSQIIEDLPDLESVIKNSLLDVFGDEHYPGRQQFLYRYYSECQNMKYDIHCETELGRAFDDLCKRSFFEIEKNLFINAFRYINSRDVDKKMNSYKATVFKKIVDFNLYELLDKLDHGGIEYLISCLGLLGPQSGNELIDPLSCIPDYLEQYALSKSDFLKKQYKKLRDAIILKEKSLHGNESL